MVSSDPQNLSGWQPLVASVGNHGPTEVWELSRRLAHATVLRRLDLGHEKRVLWVRW